MARTPQPPQTQFQEQNRVLRELEKTGNVGAIHISGGIKDRSCDRKDAFPWIRHLIEGIINFIDTLRLKL